MGFSLLSSRRGRLRRDLATSWQNYASSRVAAGEEIVELARCHRGPVRGLRVLDLGCGDGGLSVAFARHGATVHAIDVSLQRVVNARAHAAAESAPLSVTVAADGC